MKMIDFTQAGGFPLTQDELNYLQSAYTECINAVALMGGSSSIPYKISGMVITHPTTGTYDVTDGWFFYNNELIRFVASGITGMLSGNDAFVVINSIGTTLTYNNGSTPTVILDKTASLHALPIATATDTSHFLLSALLPFQLGFGLAGRETGWNVLTVATDVTVGGVSGTLYYKKNWLNNTLHLRGQLGADNAQNFSASPFSAFYSMGTLPAAYLPANTAMFTANYFLSSQIKDDLGVAWIKQLNCTINTTGQIEINWIKPDITVAGYLIGLNVIVPLD